MTRKMLAWFGCALPFLTYGGWFAYNQIEVAKLNRPIVSVIADGEEFTKIGVKKVVIEPHVRQWVTVVPREARHGRFRSGVPTEFLYAEVVLADGTSAHAFVPAGEIVRDVQVVPVLYADGARFIELRMRGTTFHTLNVDEIRKAAKKG